MRPVQRWQAALQSLFFRATQQGMHVCQLGCLVSKVGIESAVLCHTQASFVPLAELSWTRCFDVPPAAASWTTIGASTSPELAPQRLSASTESQGKQVRVVQFTPQLQHTFVLSLMQVQCCTSLVPARTPSKLEGPWPAGGTQRFARMHTCAHATVAGDALPPRDGTQEVDLQPSRGRIKVAGRYRAPQPQLLQPAGLSAQPQAPKVPASPAQSWCPAALRPPHQTGRAGSQ